MVKKMSFDITTEIISINNNKLTQFSSVCLRPIRYLFHGKTITLFEGKVIHSDISYPERNWKRTALAISFLIPGLILGLISKFLEGFSSTLWKEKTISSAFILANSHIKASKNMPLNISFHIIFQKYESIKKRMTSEKIWNDHHFISLVTDFMNDAEIVMDQLYSELEKLAQDHIKTMENKLGQKVCEMIQKKGSNTKHNQQRVFSGFF